MQGLNQEKIIRSIDGKKIHRCLLAILTEYLWKNSGAVEADEEDEEAKYSTF